MSKSTVVLGVLTGVALAVACCGACKCAKGDNEICCPPKKSKAKKKHKSMSHMMEDMVDDMMDIDMEFVGDMKDEISEDFEELAKNASHALIHAGKSLKKMVR